jgi:hypothetical protein
MAKKKKDEIENQVLEEDKEEIIEWKEEPKKKKKLSNEDIARELFERTQKIAWLNYPNIKRHIQYLCKLRNKDDKTVNNKEREAIQKLYKEITGGL